MGEKQPGPLILPSKLPPVVLMLFFGFSQKIRGSNPLTGWIMKLLVAWALKKTIYFFSGNFPGDSPF